MLVVGWDGLRPDLIAPDVTPNLCQLLAESARYLRPTAVFPSETRPNNSTIGTGCQPGRHGITANYLSASGIGGINTGEPADVLKIGQRYGRILPPPTLGEVLHAEGKRLAVLGSGSPGQTLLQNPHGAGWVINRAIRIPASLDDQMLARFGPVPDRQDSAAVDGYLQRVLLEWVLADFQPDAAILWSCEPDVSLHKHGLGSAEVRSALATNDARLGELLSRLDLSRTTVLFMSDHGHSTVKERVDPAAELISAGLATRGEVAVVASGVNLKGRARQRIDEVARFLRSRPWCGPLFARDGLPVEDVPSASVLWDGAPGRWVPDLQWSYGWDDAPNARGVPGRSYSASPPRVQTDHGTLSPRDMGNVLALYGASVRPATELSTPAGTVDVAPTILHLLGVSAPSEWQGRPLHEAFEGGVEPDVTSESLAAGTWGRLVRRRVESSTYVAVETP